MKANEIKKINKKEREGKIKELKMELVKSKIKAQKGKNAKEIRRMIARILTLNKVEKNTKNNNGDMPKVRPA